MRAGRIFLAMIALSSCSSINAYCPVKWEPPAAYSEIPSPLPVEWDLPLWDVDAKCRQPSPRQVAETKGGRYTGCAIEWETYWEIVVAKTDTAQGINEQCHELLIEHEWGHVNGWPADHPGAVRVTW